MEVEIFEGLSDQGQESSSASLSQVKADSGVERIFAEFDSSGPSALFKKVLQRIKKGKADEVAKAFVLGLESLKKREAKALYKEKELSNQLNTGKTFANCVTLKDFQSAFTEICKQAAVDMGLQNRGNDEFQLFTFFLGLVHKDKEADLTCASCVAQHEHEYFTSALKTQNRPKKAFKRGRGNLTDPLELQVHAHWRPAFAPLGLIIPLDSAVSVSAEHTQAVSRALQDCKLETKS